MPDLTVLSLGAGVQSTCLYLMACNGETDERPDIAIFADTGWEPASVYEHLDKLKSAGDIPIRIVSRGNIRTDFLSHIERWRENGGGWSRVGQPPFYVKQPDELAIAKGASLDQGGTLWRQCTRDYKIEPIQKEIRRLLGYKKGERVKKHVHQWFGISLDEIHRMKDPGVKWMTNCYPLIDMRMDRTNCIAWLKRNGWGDVPRSACIGCPYHKNSYWRDMKINKPSEWEDAVEFDKELRDGPYPKVTGKVYLHRNFIPLEEVDLSTPEDRGQYSFLDECDGMCGV